MAKLPKDMPPGRMLQRIIERGRLPNATIDFPRYDAEGNAVAQVYLRPLTQGEVDGARANAIAYVAEVLSSQRKPDWKPEELEDNAFIAEILAVACRDPDDQSKPFFEHGVVEARMHCTTEEMAMLFAAYNEVREKSYPALREMSEAELLQLMRLLEEDAEQFPFWRVSRSKLQGFCVWAARFSGGLIRQLAGTTSSS
jgi:hypothetical protein